MAQQYAAYLAFKEASDMADLKTRMAGMNERIAKLEVRGVRACVACARSTPAPHVRPGV